MAVDQGQTAEVDGTSTERDGPVVSRVTVPR